MTERQARAVRLSDAENAEIQHVAERDGVSWSEAARRMIRYAAQKMPEGWHR